MKMGLLDFLQDNNPLNFLDSRQGDFIPLQDTNDEKPFGPGPLMIMYAVPSSLDDEELLDMIEDGMPNRKRGEVQICRIDGMDLEAHVSDASSDSLLDLSVEDALNEAMEMARKGGKVQCDQTNHLPPSKVPSVQTIEVTPEQCTHQHDICPVLYFSGTTNTEMMQTYRIIANEIYEETNRRHWPACAKVVKPAMKKSLRRVLSEISGDHADAMRMRREEAEQLEQ